MATTTIDTVLDGEKPEDKPKEEEEEVVEQDQK